MKPEKFAFDTEFDENGQILREGESYKRFFTQDDIDAARMWGVEEGRMEEEGRCADALQAITSQMQIILARLAGDAEMLRIEATNLALASARKIGGASLDRFPVDTILAVAKEAINDLHAEPRFSVRCQPDLMGMVMEGMEKAAKDAGYEGKVITRGDDEMKGADVRLEWGSGAITRSATEIDKRLEEIIQRWLDTPPEEDQQTIDASDPSADASAA
jgi:flagellar assembly protein FliH